MQGEVSPLASVLSHTIPSTTLSPLTRLVTTPDTKRGPEGPQLG